MQEVASSNLVSSTSIGAGEGLAGLSERQAQARGVAKVVATSFPGAIECPACACRHPMERWKELERQGRVKIGCGPPNQEGAPGPDEYGDANSEGRRNAYEASAGWTLDLETRDADLRRFKKLTDEMREPNGGGIASDDVIEAVNHLDDRDDPPEPWPPAAPNGNGDNVLSGKGIANAQRMTRETPPPTA